jgi:hypothetical protein
MRHLFLLLVVVLVSGCFPKKESTLTVAELNVPADSITSVPHLVTDGRGNVLLSWVERRKDTSRFWFSRLQPSGWSDPTLIARGPNWFINWADYPMISSDGGKNMIAHMLDRSGKGTYAYDVKVFTSVNSGLTWHDPFVLHDDGKLAEHGFVSLVPFGEKIFVTWLDGRNASMEGMESVDHSGHHGSMTLRAAILDYSGNKSGEWELDPKTCDCCQTAAAITPQGPVVIYRDRSDEEVRDMSIVRLVNGAWTQPASIHRDNWKIAGCPVNGPRVAVRGNSLAVAWFSAVTQPGIVNLILSDDGGESFGEAIRVDEGNPIGRVDIEWIDDDRCVISWMEGALIKMVIVHADGRKEAPLTIAESSESRSSGFPQMTRSGERLVFAWTDVNQKRIRSATVTLN